MDSHTSAEHKSDSSAEALKWDNRISGKRDRLPGGGQSQELVVSDSTQSQKKKCNMMVQNFYQINFQIFYLTTQILVNVWILELLT